MNLDKLARRNALNRLRSSLTESTKITVRLPLRINSHSSLDDRFDVHTA